jgi:hypothetical protein
MHRAVARRIALVTIGIGSVLLGLFLITNVATRDRIGNLPTAQLLAILALLVLPGATWLAWRFDRRHHAGAPAAPMLRQVPAAPPTPEPDLPTRVLHAGPNREPAASHRHDVRPGRSRTP